MKKVFLVLLLFFIGVNLANAKTLTYPVATGSDDGYATIGGSVNYWTATLPLPATATDRSTYVRWAINIPAGSVISSAYIKFKNSSGSTVPISIGVIDLDNCPSFVTNPKDYSIMGSPIVSAFTSSNGTWTSPDIKSLITAFQERAGYAVGNFIAFKFTYSSGVGGSYVYAFEQGSEYAPVLEISYTQGNAIIDCWMAEPYIKTKQYIFPRITNQEAGDILKIYLDDVEQYSYTFLASDIPTNPATVWTPSSGILLDYTALVAGEHHIDVLVKQGETTRGTWTKTWTTLHNGYPKVGINENNAFCLRNEAGTGCDLYFPILSFMLSQGDFYPTQKEMSTALNGFAGEGYSIRHNPASSISYLDASFATIDSITGKEWLSTQPLRGEYERIRGGKGYALDTYQLGRIDNGHYYRCTTAGYTYDDTGLKLGSDTTKVAYRDFLYTISETQYTKAANSVGQSLPVGTIPQNKYGIYRLSIDAEGSITVTPGDDNATGYENLTTYSSQIGARPALPANSADMGYIIVKSTAASGFIAGTTTLNDASVWVEYNEAMSSVPTYCTTSGCTTVDGTSVWTESGSASNPRTLSLATANSNCSTPVSSFDCSYVNQMKDHPGLLGWLFEDEPSIGGPSVWKPPSSLRENYIAVKANDTNHPHFGGMYGYDFQKDSNSPAYQQYSWLTNSVIFNGTKTWLYDIIGGDIYVYGFVYADGTLLNKSGVDVTLESTLAMEDTYITHNAGLIPTIAVPCPRDVGHWPCSHIETAGTGYTPATGLPVTGGSGTGMTMRLTSSGTLKDTGWEIVNMGTGYKPEDIVTVVQGTNTTGSIHLSRLTPTGPQLKNELWLRVIHGVKAVEYFDLFCPQHKYQRDEAIAFKGMMESGDVPLDKVVLAEKSLKYTPSTRTVAVEGVGNVVIPANHATVTAGTDGRVDYMIREHNGETWVFAARVKQRAVAETFENCSECGAGNPNKGWPDSNNTNTKTATIPVTGLTANTVVTVYGEGRTITSGTGTITDNFTDYDVHIYRMGTEIEGDTTAPIINTFTIPPTSDSLTVPILSFSSFDSTGVTGYCVTTINSSAGCSWSATPQASITFSSEGSQTGYAWVKDAANNISTASTSSVTIDTTADYILTVSTSGTSSGSISSSPTGIDCGQNCSASYAENTEVTLTATPAARTVFDGWSGGGCSGTGTCVTTITDDTSIIASFSTEIIPSYTVTVSYAGTGTGVTSPSPATFERAVGEAINISQTPTNNSTFAGWSGTCGCTGTDTCVATMPTEDCTVIATWNAGITITPSVIGTTGGIITSPLPEVITAGESITFAGIPHNGWRIKTWGGSCSGSIGEPGYTITPSEDCSVTVEFEEIKVAPWTQQ